MARATRKVANSALRKPLQGGQRAAIPRVGLVIGAFPVAALGCISDPILLPANTAGIEVWERWGDEMLKQGLVAVVGACATAALSPAMAQTANFKCPKPGTTVEYADGGRVIWQAQEGASCRLASRQPNSNETVTIWFAPALSARADQGSGYAAQLKVSTLWPLAVGKKLTGRYDGPSGTASYQGSWLNTVNIDGYEKVTTKAGTFDAFVVTKQEEAISHKFRSTQKVWYAPEPGVTVKFTYSDSNGASRSTEAVSIK